MVLPRLPTVDGDRELASGLGAIEKRALAWTGFFTLGFLGLLLWGLIPETGILRHPETGSILKSPFINGIVTIIALYAGIADWLYGRLSGSFQSNRDAIGGMESSMATMASYLVLMFFAAQFVSYFSWSQMGIIFAIKGAGIIRAAEPATAVLLISFVLFSALINLLIGSASAKWALLAPIFVPMLLLSGISPEATQIAYRIGNGSTNIITPLMPYFGVVIAFAQRYDKEIGIGTLIATMVPYSLLFLLGWSLMLLAWISLDLPLGPGARILLDGIG